MVFKSEAELKAFLLPKIKKAVVDVEEKAHRIIDDCLKQFYSEFEPNEYIRTQQLLHSLVRSGVKSTGNGYEAEVYFDAGLLNYQTGDVPLQHTSEHGMYGYATWDGQKVLDVAMTSGLPHGGYAGGTAIWNTSMGKLGDILGLLLNALKSQGIPIK